MISSRNIGSQRGHALRPEQRQVPLEKETSMRLHRIIIVTALVCGLAATAFAAAVLKVNSVEITPGQLAIAKYKVCEDTPSLAGNEAAATKAAVDLLVADVMLADAAREAGVALTEKDVQKGIAFMQNRLGGKAAYTNQLSKLGASEQELKELAARHMLAQRYIGSGVSANVTVTEAEARAYYEKPENQIFHGDQLRLRMIFVNAPPGISEKDEAKAKARIDEAERRVLAGEEFATVAKEMSDDMTKANGGDLDWIGVQAIPQQFVGKVWAIEPGAITEVLRGKFGFGLFEVTAKRARGPMPFEEIREQVTAQIHKSKTDAAVAALVAKRRAAGQVQGITPETAAALKH
jgi:peptidyl-prolyl cis-trans isomerase C